MKSLCKNGRVISIFLLFGFFLFDRPGASIYVLLFDVSLFPADSKDTTGGEEETVTRGTRLEESTEGNNGSMSEDFVFGEWNDKGVAQAGMFGGRALVAALVSMGFKKFLAQKAVQRKIRKLILSSKNYKKRAGREKMDRQGGVEQANKEFDYLQPKNVKEIKTKYGAGRQGELATGDMAVVRPGSSGGPATLEIQSGGNSIKFRY